MPRNMTADHIAGTGQAAGYEPQRQNHFVFLIPNLPNNGSEVLRLSVAGLPFPVRTNGKITIPYGNEARHVAGRITVEDVEINFHDYVDKDTYGVIWAWRKLVYNEDDGTIGLAKDYKRDGELILVGPNGVTERGWTYQGLWPVADPKGDVKMDGDDPVMLAVSFSVDKIKRQV